MVDPRHIVDSTLVPHTAFDRGSVRLEQCFTYADGAVEPICLAVLGESRTGKSRVLEECYANHAKVRDSEGLTIPILRVTTPSKPTVMGLVELMLQAMKDPKFDVGSENGKTMRLRKLMRGAGTRMVMIDEFQHFYDKVSHKVQHHVADWLKIVVDRAKVALVVAGLPGCRAVIDQNEQLAGRFLSPVILPRFDWNIDDHREEFIGILGAFQESIGEFFDLPKLDSAEMVFRCYCATGGLIGYLTKFLRQAVWDAMDDNRKTITLEHLAEAHEESVWMSSGVTDIPAPFRRSFVPLPSPDLLAKILHIGTPVEPVIAPRKRRPKPHENDITRHALSPTL
jgi:hypothetical protein